MSKEDFTQILKEDMEKIFHEILLKCGFSNSKALQCAEVFTANSIDGVYSHGVNRFATFVKSIRSGLIDVQAEPTIVSNFGAMEQWNGHLAAGPLNAISATEKAIILSQQYGLGCVAMANTNHWMRGGYYGWVAAKRNKVLIAWTNTIANMPAWNATDSRLGNNPLVLALPYNNEAIVLDMAMSQFSFGAMEMSAMKKEKLSVQGGFDKDGILTNDPATIIETGRAVPVGFWKGAGLSLLLDIVATILSGGLSTKEVTKQGKESGLSQVFICIDLEKLNKFSLIKKTVNGIIDHYKDSLVSEGRKISYPGERVLQSRKDNLANGIPVLKKVWEKIVQL